MHKLASIVLFALATFSLNAQSFDDFLNQFDQVKFPLASETVWSTSYKKGKLGEAMTQKFLDKDYKATDPTTEAAEMKDFYYKAIYAYELSNGNHALIYSEEEFFSTTIKLAVYNQSGEKQDEMLLSSVIEQGDDLPEQIDQDFIAYADETLLKSTTTHYKMDYTDDEGDFISAYAMDKTAQKITILDNGKLSTKDLPSEKLDKDALEEYTNFDLRLQRNLIFARKGYKFKAKDLATFFDSISWYKANSTDVTDQLSEIDRYNIDLIKSIEKAHK